MDELTPSQKALLGASVNAQRAFDAAFDPAFSGVPADEKNAWAMAAILHCDLCRLVVALDECRQPGLARLMWMAEISSKLYEAKDWYFKDGAKSLLAIARRKTCGPEAVRARLKQLNANYAISAIDRYAIYRNKVGYHYDSEALDVIRRLGGESSEEYFGIVMTFARYSGAWAALAKDVIKGLLPPVGESGAAHADANLSIDTDAQHRPTPAVAPVARRSPLR